MPASTDQFPLFPLATVLFPGARLDLRIFERRYLDLVGDCARRGAGFGVCGRFSAAGGQGGAERAAVGTAAQIEDFRTLPDGLLGISTRGGQRFRIVSTHTRDDGLCIGAVVFLPPDPTLPVPAECGILATILRRLADSMGGELAAAVQSCFDDAAWVGWRLAKCLPLAMQERQQLLACDDPLQRLRWLSEWLPRFQRA